MRIYLMKETEPGQYSKIGMLHIEEMTCKYRQIARLESRIKKEDRHIWVDQIGNQYAFHRPIIANGNCDCDWWITKAWNK